MAPGKMVLGDQEAHVWCIGVNTITMSAPGQMLDTAELERANKFHSTEHARQYQTIRGLLRIILSSYLGCDSRAIGYVQNAYGKPDIKVPPESGLMFNLSHSDNLALIVVARRDVGVDVERIDPGFPTDEIARSFFSPTELTVLNKLSGYERLNAFYRLWTRKEALLKATGEGLDGLTRDIDLLTKNKIIRQERAWHIWDLSLAEGYAGALAIHGNIIDVKYIDLDSCRPLDVNLFLRSS